MTSPVRIAVLAIVLVVAYFVYYKLNQNGLPSGLSGYATGSLEDIEKVREFKDPQKEQVKRLLAGFWEFQSDPLDLPVGKIDRVELKDNGIIWSVEQWEVALPDSDTVRISRAFNAYLNPYGYLDSATGVYRCEVRILRQTYIVGDDTCYGESQSDQIWEAARRGDRLRLNGRLYGSYGGELGTFFPQGMLDIVDRLVNTQCHRSSMSSFARAALDTALSKRGKVAGPEPVAGLLERYYKTMSVDEVVRPFTKSRQPLPQSVTIELRIGPRGDVVAPPHIRGAVLQTKFGNALLREMQGWVFGPVDSTIAPLTVNHTFTIRKL